MQEIWEVWVLSLNQEDPLEEEMATILVFLPAKSQRQGSLVGYSPWGRKESDTVKSSTIKKKKFILEPSEILLSLVYIYLGGRPNFNSPQDHKETCTSRQRQAISQSSKRRKRFKDLVSGPLNTLSC